MVVPRKVLPILLVLLFIPAAHAHVSLEAGVDTAMREIEAHLGKIDPTDLQGALAHAKEIDAQLGAIKGDLDLGADYNGELARRVDAFESDLRELEEATAEGDEGRALAASTRLRASYAGVNTELRRPKVDGDRLALALGGLLGAWLLLATLLILASARLQTRVLKERAVEVFPGEGLCGACGACEVACPEGALEVTAQGPSYLGGADCGSCEAPCIAVCPVQFPGEWGGLGTIRKAVAVRSRSQEVRTLAQDGGLATTLAIHLLESRRVEGVLLVGRHGLDPEPFVARTGGEALTAAGSTYALSPSLPALQDVVGKLAMVGLPCQVTGAEKLGALGKVNIAFKVGLFCRANFLPGGMENLAARAGVSPEGIRRVDIAKGKVRLDGKAEFPLKALVGYENPGCKVCADPLARRADVSIGGVGVPRGWSLALVRTREGEAVLDEMVERGLVETAPVDSKARGCLERFARAKMPVKP